MKYEVSGFECSQDNDVNDPDFWLIWTKCLSHDLIPHFHIYQGFLFRGLQLCIPVHSLRDLLVVEVHGGGLATHVGRDKTIAMLEDQFFLAPNEPRHFQVC